MAGRPELIGLLYRADWTRLSLSAELRSEAGREPLKRQSREDRARWYHAWPGQQQDNGRYEWRGALLVGPGGRWRLDYSDPSRNTAGEAAEGYDGEHSWSWRPPEVEGPPSLPAKVNGAYPPVPELFCPSRLLGGYTLEELGPVTVAGRDAIAVAATPRRDVLGSGSAERPYDRIEFAVDAELGILLRRLETSGGELVTLTELTGVTMNPPEAADPGGFAPPPGSHRGPTPGENPQATPIGPGSVVADLVGGSFGTLLRNLPISAGGNAPDEPPEPMPSPDPAPLEPADGPPPPDEILDLLYRSGEPHNLGATARQWHDQAAMVTWSVARTPTAGRGGVAAFIDAMTRGINASYTQARLRLSDPDHYRVDYSRRPRRIDSTTIACDGETRWRVYPDRTVVSPPGPLRSWIMSMTESSWLLRSRLSGGAELTYHGRLARQFRVTSVPDGGEPGLGLLMMLPGDAIVDAETGCLLRLIFLADGTPIMWSELDDISTGPIDPGEFRVHIPAGTRTVEETGNPITDAAAGIPGVKGTAARAAAEAVNRTAGAVSAARSFLDDLRGRR